MGVGEKHAEAYLEHQECDVVYLCDINEKRLQNVSRKYPNCKITSDANQLINCADLDIISIASHDNFHFEQTSKAIYNNKHVFVEKPLCFYENEAKSIRKALDNNPNIRLSSNLALRSCPKFIELQEAISKGELGELFYVEADYLWGRTPKLTDGWRKNLDYYSIVLGAAIHMIDLVIWMTSMLPVSVQAMSNNIATRDTDFGFDSFALIMMEFKNGMIAKVTGNGGCVHPHFHTLNVFGKRKTASHQLCGSKLIEQNGGEMNISDLSGNYPAKGNRKHIILSFIDSIIDDNELPMVSTDDVFGTMSVAFACEKAIENKTVQYINYDLIRT